MSASGGTKAIIAAFAGQPGHRGHQVHRVALLGIVLDARRGRALARRLRQPAAAAARRPQARKKRADSEHPFGYGRERYVYAFVVSIILFSVGGVFSLYEGIEKMHASARARELVAADPGAGRSRSASSRSRCAPRSASRDHIRGKQSWVAFIRHAKAPELPVVLLEDVAALTGLVFALSASASPSSPATASGTRSARSLIGVLLIARRRSSSASRRRACSSARARPTPTSTPSSGASSPAPRSSAHPHEDPLPRAGRAARRREDRGSPGRARLADVAAAIDAVETRIRAAVPAARVIYIEPDVYRPERRRLRRPTPS